MKKKIIILLPLCLFLISSKHALAIIKDCQGWTHPTEMCPIITSVSPAISTVDDIIVITGSEFEQEQGKNKISFWYDDPNASYLSRATYDATGQIISWSV